MNARTQSFFDQGTSTFSYVVFDPISQFCIVIDPVLNYDPKSGRTNTSSTDIVISFIKENHLKLDWILETHAHADHLSAAAYLRDELGGKVAIGEEIVRVQNVFKGIFNLGDEFKVDGSQFDYLLKDQETITFGNLSFKSLFVPGHTPACMAYEIEDSIFVGDTMFMPDVGTARCDFPGGEAATLYHSIKKILSYPAETKLYMCHDYPPPSRSAQFLTSVKDQRTSNIHVNDSVGLNDFISMRAKRDKELEMPVLILPAIQINIRAGKMPPKETNGTSYLKIPLNLV
jgi:glyoxylase-like metal-dependent hydrolase (beta-lactamase superfamily II)